MELHPDAVWYMGDNGRPVVLCDLRTGEPVQYGQQWPCPVSREMYAVNRDRDPLGTPRHILAVTWPNGDTGTWCFGSYSERNAYPVLWVHGEAEVHEVWLAVHKFGCTWRQV